MNITPRQFYKGMIIAGTLAGIFSKQGNPKKNLDFGPGETQEFTDFVNELSEKMLKDDQDRKTTPR